MLAPWGWRSGGRQQGPGAPVPVPGFVAVPAAETSGVEAVLAILKPGNSFGELSLIDGLPRSANVVAMSPTVCYFLPKDAFTLVLKENLEIAYAMLPALASMVRNSNQWVAQLIEGNKTNETQI